MCLLTRKAHGYSERGREGMRREGGKEEDEKTKLGEWDFLTLPLARHLYQVFLWQTCVFIWKIHLWSRPMQKSKKKKRTVENLIFHIFACVRKKLFLVVQLSWGFPAVCECVCSFAWDKTDRVNKQKEWKHVVNSEEGATSLWKFTFPPKVGHPASSPTFSVPFCTPAAGAEENEGMPSPF